MLTVKRILHPTDFSPSSNAAFELACAMARDYRAKLTVLHVVAPPIVAFGEGVIPPDPTNYLAQAHAQLETVQPRDPKIEIERRLVEGDTVAEILRMAKEINCDAIVLGTHGRTGVGRLLMGSVAEQIVRKATCPVIAVKTPVAGVQ